MLYSGLIVDNTYQIIEEIGAGGMGVVYLAYHLRLQKYIVMKKIKNCNADMALLRNEVDVLKGLHHPYLPQVYDFIQYNGNLYTIIDYIEGYDLKYYIDNNYTFSESQLIKWFRQLCEVLEYLHSHTPQVLHTDIKPANIIVTANNDICLIDFGISMFGTEEIKGISAEYSSPEQYNNVQNIYNGCREYCVQMDERVDIYSLGATFYHIITGIKPSVLMAQSKATQYNLGYSKAFAEIIDKCKEPDRDRRFRHISQTRKALDNIYKLDVRYKRYIVYQVLTSLLAGILIVSGAIMTIKGYRNGVLIEYEAVYNQFIQTSVAGDIESAVSAGYSLINNSKYKSVMDADTKAVILHTLGDCYYKIGDYNNAAHFYNQAISVSKDHNEKQLYYRDYVFALINNGKQDMIDSVLAEISALYPDSRIEALVEAQLSYKNKNYATAIEKAKKLVATLPKDSDNMYTAYLIMGDSYNELGDYYSAMDAYSEAMNTRESEEILRKLSNATLKYASSTNNIQSYRQAKDSFNRLCTYYTPDVNDIVNLAQSYLLCGEKDDYNKCIELLKDYTEAYGDNCMVYIMLAIASDAVGSPDTQEYCMISRQLYYELSSEEKQQVDFASMEQIKELFRKYCGGVW